METTMEGPYDELLAIQRGSQDLHGRWRRPDRGVNQARLEERWSHGRGEDRKYRAGFRADR